MKITAIIRLCLVGLALCTAVPSVRAAPNCNAEIGSPFIGSMALNITSINVPRDAAIGAAIYKQGFTAGAGTKFLCDIQHGTDTQVSFRVDDLLANTGIVGADSFYSGRIHKTNVPGIGVSWHVGQGNLRAIDDKPLTLTLVPGCSSPLEVGLKILTCITGNLGLGPPTLVLFKIGPVSAGRIDSTKLGKFVMSGQVLDRDGTGWSNIFTIGSLAIRGSIDIVEQTCSTPSVSVDMGSQKVSLLKGLGSATPPVNFNIALTNCPGFPGLLTDGASLTKASSTEKTDDGRRVAPVVKIRIDPQNTAVDAANGVLNLSTSASYASASGVGVQVLNEAGTPVKLSESVDLSPALLLASTTALDIKFSARYIQTANKVTPGKANAVATYTLTYQ